MTTWKQVLLGFLKVVGPAGYAAGGFLLHDMIDFRNKQNEATLDVIKQVRDDNEEISKLLLKFSRFALGGSPVSEDDRKSLDEALLKSYHSSERLKYYIPSIDKPLSDFENSLIGLRKGAEVLQGPSTGKQFVMSASEYINDQELLDLAIAQNKRN